MIEWNLEIIYKITWMTIKIIRTSWAPVAHACNLSYSGGRSQEDHGSKPAQANSSRDPVLKNPSLKKG
jgi:hypothetical protein